LETIRNNQNGLSNNRKISLAGSQRWIIKLKQNSVVNKKIK